MRFSFVPVKEQFMKSYSKTDYHALWHLRDTAKVSGMNKIPNKATYNVKKITGTLFCPGNFFCPGFSSSKDFLSRLSYD